MDRFIDCILTSGEFPISCLKSNMDRFIELYAAPATKCDWSLKSNMDRFIEFIFVFCELDIIV